MFMLQVMTNTFTNIALVNRLLIGRLLVDASEFILSGVRLGILYGAYLRM
jgi:hypothetical protein